MVVLTGYAKPHDWPKLSDVLTDISHMITIALFNNSSSLSIQNADIILKLLMIIIQVGISECIHWRYNWVASKCVIRKCNAVSPGQNIHVVAVITRVTVLTR